MPAHLRFDHRDITDIDGGFLMDSLLWELKPVHSSNPLASRKSPKSRARSFLFELGSRYIPGDLIDDMNES